MREPTQREQEIMTEHRDQVLGVEHQINTIEAASASLVAISCSDAMAGDSEIAKSVAWLARTINDECSEMRQKLYATSC